MGTVYPFPHFSGIRILIWCLKIYPMSEWSIQAVLPADSSLLGPGEDGKIRAAVLLVSTEEAKYAMVARKASFLRSFVLLRASLHDDVCRQGRVHLAFRSGSSRGHHCRRRQRRRDAYLVTGPPGDPITPTHSHTDV